jgi:hypothetical protein
VENLLANSIWQTEGYAYVIKVADNKAEFFDLTKKHCIINYYLTNQWRGVDAVEHMNLLNRYSANIEMGAAQPIKLDWIESLPQLCLKKRTKTVYDKNFLFDALNVFDVFWNTYAEIYPFESDINWNDDEHYLGLRNKLSPITSEEELLVVLEDILKLVNDGHYLLVDQNFEQLIDFNPRSFDFKSRLEHALNRDNKNVGFWPFYWSLVEKLENNRNQYFLRNSKPTVFHDNFMYQSLDENLGYFSIKEMYGFLEKDDVELHVDATEIVMKELITKFRDIKGLVVDLRFNEGGIDLVTLKLLSYFVDKPTVIGSKQRKSFSELGQKQFVEVIPVKDAVYTGPIVVITSELTASAAELFMLGLQARGNVIFIGEQSNGSYSDILEKQLPNGWILGLSHELYRDSNGANHEIKGFPVSKKIEFLNLNDVESGRDNAIEEAITILKKIKKKSF